MDSEVAIVVGDGALGARILRTLKASDRIVTEEALLYRPVERGLQEDNIRSDGSLGDHGFELVIRNLDLPFAPLLDKRLQVRRGQGADLAVPQDVTPKQRGQRSARGAPASVTVLVGPPATSVRLSIPDWLSR